MASTPETGDIIANAATDFGGGPLRWTRTGANAASANAVDDYGRWEASLDSFQRLLWSAASATSDFLGAETVSDLTYQYAQDNLKELSKYQRDSMARGEVEFGENFSGWLADTLIIDALPTIATMAGTAASAYLTGGATLPALLAIGSTSVLNLGEIYGESRAEVGKENISPSVVLAATGVSAALDVITPYKVASKFFPGGVRGFKEKALQELGRNGGVNKLSRLLKEGLRGANTEGYTEALQNYSLEVAVNIQAGKENPFEIDNDDFKDLLDAYLAGGVLGGAARGGTAFVGTGQAREIIAARDSAEERIGSDLDATVSPIEKELSDIEAKLKKVWPSSKERVTLNAEKRKLQKQIDQAKKDASDKRRKVRTSYTIDDINKIVPIKEQEAEPETEAAPEKEKTLAQIMAEDPRTAEAERQQQPDEVLPVGTQRGPSATQEQINARLAQEPSGPTQADVMPDVMPGTPVAPRPGTATAEAAARADRGLDEETTPTFEDRPSGPPGGPPVAPRPGTPTANRAAAEAAARAERGLQEEGFQDPSVLEDTAPMESGADPSVLLDQAPDQVGAGPQGRPRRSFAALRDAIKARTKGPQVMNRPVINTVIGDSENVLVDGDVLITAADIEEAKFAKASRELEDEASTAYNEAYNEVVLETGGDHGQASIAGEEARTRVLREGGATRRRVYSSRAARLQAQREAAKQRQDREARLNFEAQRRIDEQKKFEKEQAAELKEQAIEMAGETYDAFFYGQISAQEFASRRQSEIARIKDGIGGTAAANAYRKAVPLEKANAILKERGLPTLKPEGDQTTQKDAAPDKTTPTPDAPTAAPETELTLKEFQAEYERIKAEEGEQAAADYFAREAQRVATAAEAAPDDAGEAEAAPATPPPAETAAPEEAPVKEAAAKKLSVPSKKKFFDMGKRGNLRRATGVNLPGEPQAGSGIVFAERPELTILERGRINGFTEEDIATLYLHNYQAINILDFNGNKDWGGSSRRQFGLEDLGPPKNKADLDARIDRAYKKYIEDFENAKDPITERTPREQLPTDEEIATRTGAAKGLSDREIEAYQEYKVKRAEMDAAGKGVPTAAADTTETAPVAAEDTEAAPTTTPQGKDAAPAQEAETTPDETTAETGKATTPPDIAVTDVDEDQTQDQQIADMIAREQATVAREAADEQAEAEFQAGTDDTGPTVEDVEAGVDIPEAGTIATTPDLEQVDIADETVTDETAIAETVIPEVTTTGIELDKYESSVPNPQGVEAIVYEDPENPGSFIVESEGVVIRREPNKQDAVLYADKMSEFVANREKKKARNAFVPRPEGKAYTGEFLKGLGRGARALLAGTGKNGDSFRLSLDKNKQKIAENNDIPYDDTTTEEDLYDALYAKYIAPKEEATPTDAGQADIAGEVQEEAERIVASDYDMFGNKINRAYPEPIDEYSSDEEADAIIAASEAKQEFAETDDPSALIDLDWDDGDAEIRAEAAAEAEETARRTAKNRAVKLTPEYWTEMLDTNTALKDISKTKSQGGFEISELRTIADNILKADPSFVYNKEGTRKEIEAAIKSYIIKDVEPVEDNSPYIDTVDDDTGIISTEYKESRIDSDSVEQEPFLSGEVLFSKDEVASSIRQELKKIFGVRATNEMFSTGFVKILSRKQAAAEHKESKREFKDTAAFVRNASVTFIPDNIVKSNATPDTIRGLIWHEIGAHVGRSMLSSNEFSAIIKEVRRLHKQGDVYVLAAFDAVANNYKDIYKDFAKPVTTNVLGERIIYAFKTKDGKNPIDVIGTDNIFWEEVLAHMLEYKGQELDLQRASLMKRVKDAFKKFFIRVFKAYDVDSIPDVTVDDIFNTMAGVVIERIPPLIQRAKMFDASREKAVDEVADKFIDEQGIPYAWANFDDSRKEVLRKADGYLADAQTKARNEFIEDSLVKGTVYHGSEKNWSAPILELTEMGLHVGTMKAALKIVKGNSEKLTEGYIKVTNPFTGVDDIGHWAGPLAWRNELNRMMRDGNISDKDYQLLFSVANEWVKKLEPFKGSKEIYDGFVKFSSEYRDTLKSLGYDSIQYVNKSEDPGNLSYILLSEDQFKASSSFTFTSGVNAVKDARIASESPSKNLPIMKKINDESKGQVFNTRKAQGKITQVIKTLQRAVEPLMTLEGYDELETQRMLTKGEIGKWHNQGRVIFDVIFQATPEEKKEIIKYFETRDASPDKLPNRKVNVAKLPTVLSGTKGTGRLSEEKSIRDSVVEAKKQIEKLGADLVAAGLITQDQYSQWRGKYLPRVYFEYLDKGDRIPMGIGTSQMNYTKVRSAHENFLKDVVEGRIEDPAFLAGRYVSMAGADLATINYLSFLAADTGNNGWVLPNQIVKYDNMEGTVGFWNEKIDAIRRNASRERGLNNSAKADSYEKIANQIQKEVDKVTANKIVSDPKKYKQVPDNPRYGAMRGLYVRKEIINDVLGTQQLYTNNEFLNGALSYTAKAQKVFKYTKVPMNIPTQARNVISNIVLMDVSGTNFFRIPGLISRAITDIASDGKYAQLARKYGIESTTFTAEELVNIDAQLSKIKAKEDSWGGMWAKTKVFFNDYVDVFGRTYQKTEVMFKVAKMIDFMENHGKSESEAAKLANEALLDYSNVSQAVRVIRTMPLGSPFITFNLKAASQMVRNIKNHPIAVAKYAAIPYVVAQMLLENNSELEEDDIPEMKKLVAEYMEDNATSFILPWKDQEGRLRVFDMGYFLPWGAHLNMMKNLYQGEFGKASSVPGFFGGWIGAPIGMITNVDPFTKQEITNDADPPMQQYQDMTAFLLSYMMPPMIMPRNKSGDVISNGGQLIKTGMAMGFIDGNVDADGLPKYTIPESLMSWAGVNFSKFDKNTAQRKIYFKALDVKNTYKRLKKFLKDPNISEEQRQRLISEYTANALRLQTELQEMQNAYAKVRDVL